MTKLLEKIKKELPLVLERYGYRSEEEFVEDALRRRILELKRATFLSETAKIRKTMKKKGMSEEATIKDFESFRRKK